MTGPRDTLAGRVLDGRYRLDERIGGGGMGEVYRGRHLMLDQRVAIKLLRPTLTADPTAVKRFMREARTTFRIDHPSCVRVTDLGATDDGLLYLVMDYLDGRTVADDIRVDGAIAPGRVARIARHVCDALAYAHGLGLVHRDLKPENLMLVRRGQDPDVVKVLDFGLAKLVTGPDGALSAAFSMSPLTREGMVFGTPEYMSPEQAMGEPLSPLTDIYSLGVVMYEMLTGELPFANASFMAVLTMHVRDLAAPPSARRPDLAIPPGLEAVVMQCLSKNPAARPQGAGSLAALLDAVDPARTPAAPRVSDQVAASSTVDLDPRALASSTVDLDPPVLASSTADLDPRALASSPVDRDPHVLASASLSTFVAMPVQPAPAPTHAQHTHAAAVSGPAPRLRRTPGIVALGVLGVTVVGALLVVGATSSDTSPDAGQAAKIAATPALLPADSPPSVPGLAQVTADAGPDAQPTDSSDAGMSIELDSSPAQAAPDERPARSRSRASRAKAHIAAAEKARRAGNLLKQMAEADTALTLDPNDLHAAYLLGDALVRSDKTKGCAYLQRARRLSRAREAYRRAGCDRTD